MNMKFDAWWEEHWKDCFGIDEEKGRAKYMTSKRHKADGVRYALLCYENQHRGTNWDIAIHIQKLKLKKDILSQHLHMLLKDSKQKLTCLLVSKEKSL